MIVRRDEHIVDVEQQPAAGSLGDLGEEFGLRDRAVGEAQIGRRIFEQHRAPERRLHLVDMLGDARQGLAACRAGARGR